MSRENLLTLGAAACFIAALIYLLTDGLMLDVVYLSLVGSHLANESNHLELKRKLGLE